MAAPTELVGRTAATTAGGAGGAGADGAGGADGRGNLKTRPVVVTVQFSSSRSFVRAGAHMARRLPREVAVVWYEESGLITITIPMPMYNDEFYDDFIQGMLGRCEDMIARVLGEDDAGIEFDDIQSDFVVQVCEECDAHAEHSDAHAEHSDAHAEHSDARAGAEHSDAHAEHSGARAGAEHSDAHAEHSGARADSDAHAEHGVAHSEHSDFRVGAVHCDAHAEHSGSRADGSGGAGGADGSDMDLTALD